MSELTRTTSGLVDLEEFTGSDGSSLGAPWIEREADIGVATIQSNRLRVRETLDQVYYENDTEDLGKSFVQADVEVSHTGKRPNLVLRGDWNGGSPDGYYVQFRLNDSKLRIYRRESGTFTILGDGTISGSIDTEYAMQLFVDDDLQEAWCAAGDGTIEGTDDVFNGVVGDPAIRTIGDAFVNDQFFDNYILMRDKVITVTGLTEGQKAKVRNAGASVVAEAEADAGGVATIDCSRYTEEQAAGTGATEKVPNAGWADIQITTAGDSEILVHDADPVYPGDVYEAA